MSRNHDGGGGLRTGGFDFLKGGGAGHRFAGAARVGLLLLSAWGAAGADAPSDIEPLRHRFRFDRDSRLVYRLESTLTQNIHSPGLPDVSWTVTLTGTVSQIVVDTEGWGTRALIGQIGKSRVLMFDGGSSVPCEDRLQTWLCACRMDRQGRSLARTASPVSLFERLRRIGASQVGETSQICAAFPEGPLKPGDEWKGEAVIGMLWGRQPVDAVSRIERFERRGDATVSIVRTTVRRSLEASPGYRWTVTTPHQTIHGTTEGHFDVRRGRWIRTASDITVDLTGREEKGFRGGIRMRSSVDLVGEEPLGGSDARNRRRLFGNVDLALGSVCGNRIGKGLDILASCEREEKDPEARGAVATVRAVLEPLRYPERKAGAAQGAEEPAASRPEARWLEEAERAAAEGKMEEAVRKYLAVPERFPDSALVPEALAAAATVYEENLGNPDQAASLRRRLVSFLEGKAAGGRDPMATYKLATAYANVGDFEKAAGAFRAVVEAGGEVAVGMRLMAQCRMARAFESLGRTEEAIRAYERVEAMEAEDTYGRNLKANARARRAALRSGAPAAETPRRGP